MIKRRHNTMMWYSPASQWWNSCLIWSATIPISSFTHYGCWNHPSATADSSSRPQVGCSNRGGRLGGQDPHDLIDAIRAVEIDPQSVAQFSQQLVNYLITQRIAPNVAQKLADAWLISGDCLTINFDHPFDFVVGNPPYVRHEAIPKELLKNGLVFLCFRG